MMKGDESRKRIETGGTMATIYRGFDRDLKFRFTFAETKDLVEEAGKTHG